MSDRRRQRVVEIFHRAAGLTPEARPAFLDEVCAGDESLRKEAEALLADSAGNGRTLAGEGGTLTMFEDLTGRTIGPYRVLDRIGAGGMGVVYRAHDTQLDRTVAIKVLPADCLADADRRRRFIHEAKAASALNHPNIVTVYAITHEGGVECIVMEYVAGKTLAEATPKKGLPLNDALRIAIEIADAMAAAHAAGIVHRDLKPSNLMLTESGRVKVLDFGLAKLVEVEASSDTAPSTETGKVVGTPGYMSPEQAQGRKVDERTDIFALGCVLYEMTTGRRAFRGNSALSTLAAILHEEPAPMEGVAPEVVKLIGRCLRKDPSRRCRHMDELKLVLEELKEEPERGRLHDGSGPEKPLSRGSRKWYAAAAGAILAALLGGFGVSRLLPAWRGEAPQFASRVIRITTDPSSVWPAVSADGTMVAYLARRDGQNWAIWVQRVGAGAAIRVADGSADGLAEGAPVFSADGSKLYYVSTADPPGAYEVPVLGGEARLAIPGAQHIWPSPDGKWLAYGRESTVYVRPVAGGGNAREVTREHSASPSRLVWSPDSSRLLLTVGWDPNAKLVVFSLDGTQVGAERPLYENLARRGFSNLNNLRLYAWLPRGDIVFSARYGDAVNLWRIPLAQAAKAEPSPVTMAPWSSEMADIRGNHLVFANLRSTNQVWRLPADVNAGRVLGDPQRVTPELVEAQFPDVRPDGSALTYISRRDGGQGVFLLNLQTGKERTLFMAERNSAYSTFSPDGSQVAFGYGGPEWPVFVGSAAGGPSKPIGDAGGRLRGWSRDGRFLLIWRSHKDRDTAGVLDLTNGRVTEIVQSDLSLEHVRFSPDSRWIAFLSGAGDPRPRLWIAPFRGADPVPPADWIEITGGGILPFWSPDGRSFYYARAQENNPSDLMFFRQPMDPAGRPSGPPGEFYHARGFSIPRSFLNTISATRDHVYLLLWAGQSDIWSMDIGK